MDFVREHSSVVEFINSYRDEPLPSNGKINYYNYDWALNEISDAKKSAGTAANPPTSTSNLLQFTPSQLFRLGQFELNLFNNLYTQTFSRDKDGERTPFQNRNRLSISTSSLQFTIGVSKDARINLGADIIFSASSIGPAIDSSANSIPSRTGLLQILNRGDLVATESLVISAVGPRIKFQPFKKYPFYSIQSSLLIPVAPRLESGRSVFLALDRYLWRNQFLYDFKLTSELRLFYEFAFNFYWRRDKTQTFFRSNFADLPSTLFLNYFPDDKFSLFAMAQYNSRYGRTANGREQDPNARFGLLQWTLQLGLGIKYQATSNLGLELSYGNFVAGRGFAGIDAGGGEVINLGIRFIQ